MLSGEIDLLSRPSLADLLDAAMDGMFPKVEVDMAKVSFINATGLRVLCQAYHLGAHRGVTLTVRRPSPHLISLLRHIDPRALLLGDHDSADDDAGPPEPMAATRGGRRTPPQDRQGDEPTLDPSDALDAQRRRADQRDRAADDRERRADELDRQIGQREERAEDLQLLNEERGRLLDDRQLGVLRHQTRENIREDNANKRERELDQRDRDC